MTKKYVSSVLTKPNGFTRGIEGPACDKDGVLYAVNYERQGTIGSVSPDGASNVFIDLPTGSVGNGIRFHSDGDMLIADYTQHNILRVDMKTKAISVFSHEPRMNQPNDIAIAKNDTVYASDPDWANDSGQIWKIDNQGKPECLETNMGTTNGIEISPDEKILYVNESLQRNVWAYDILPNGKIENKRLLIQFPDFNMDGMRCDTQGNIYITRHGKGTIAKLSPTGEVLLEIDLKGQDPSNLTFGGPDGCTCYVTIQDRGNIESFQVEHPGRSWALHTEHL